MAYQRLGWPRNDIFAAGSFAFAVLGFVAAALSIPGMPRMFNFNRSADSNNNQAPMPSAMNTPQATPQASQTSDNATKHHKANSRLGGLLKVPESSSKVGLQIPYRVVDPHSAPNFGQSLQHESRIIEPYENQERSKRIQNPYQRIGELYQQVENLGHDWFGALQRMDQDRARPYKMGMPGPMPTQLSTDQAQRLKDIDEQISSQYAGLNVEIVKAHQEAVTYMNLTPNQISEDEANFVNAASIAGRRMSLDELLKYKANWSRFQPIGSYLQQLQHHLGDFR